MKNTDSFHKNNGPNLYETQILKIKDQDYQHHKQFSINVKGGQSIDQENAINQNKDSFILFKK